MCECLSFSVCGPRAVCVCLLSVSVYVYVSVLCVGGPLDLLARQVLCSATEVLARQVAENIERIDMGRD